MKEILTDIDRQNIVNYRLERAKTTLQEAIQCYKNEMWNLAINRLYYACYYAASALLIQNKIEANTHAGIKTQFSLHFIRNNSLKREHGTTLSMLYNMRHTGDYEDFFDFDKETFETYYPLVDSFINDIEQLVIKSSIQE